MEPRLVEYFVAVVDHGGIAKAARALYISQPSLSQAIRHLEGQLGVELFDRSGRHLTLNPDGVAFVAPARGILTDIDRARARVAAVRDLQAGHLELAAVSTLAVEPLPEMVARFRERNPGVLVNVTDPGDAAGAVNQVRRGQVELGLTALPGGCDQLRTFDLWAQEIVMALPPSLAAGLPDPVPLDAIPAIPLVMEFSHDSGRLPIDDRLDRVVSSVAVECAHRQAVWELVMHGAGATFLPRGIAETELRGMVVRSIEPQIRQQVRIVLRAGAPSPAAAAFLGIADLMRLERIVPPAR